MLALAYQAVKRDRGLSVHVSIAALRHEEKWGEDVRSRSIARAVALSAALLAAEGIAPALAPRQFSHLKLVITQDGGQIAGLQAW